VTELQLLKFHTPPRKVAPSYHQSSKEFARRYF